MRPTHRYGPLAIVTALLVACGGDGGSGPTVPGGNSGADGFQATVTGAVTTTFTGIAGFGSDGTQFQISLSDGRTNLIGVVRFKGGRPGVGTHALSEDPLVIQNGTGIGSTVSLGASNFGSMFSPGTLTLTSSSTERVQGTLRIEAAAAGSPTRRATIVATFNAGCTSTCR